MTPSAAPRLGVFGGAFDPPHLAHLALARCAIEQAGLDRLLLLPSGQPWHRSGTLSAPEHRLAMARLAFAGLAHAEVDDREIRRAGPTYSIDTLEELRAGQPQAEWALVIGADQANAFERWHRWRDILALATVFVAERASTISPNQQISADSALNRLRAVVQAGGVNPQRVQPIVLPPMPISATAIRERVAQGLGVAHLVPAAVAGYIAQHRLYSHPSQ